MDAFYTLTLTLQCENKQKILLRNIVLALDFHQLEYMGNFDTPITSVGMLSSYLSWKQMNPELDLWSKLTTWSLSIATCNPIPYSGRFYFQKKIYHVGLRAWNVSPQTYAKTGRVQNPHRTHSQITHHIAVHIDLQWYFQLPFRVLLIFSFSFKDLLLQFPCFTWSAWP